MPAAPPRAGLLSRATNARLNAWIYALGPGRYYDPAYRRIAGSLDITRGAILDVGCGPGWVCIHAAAGHAELDCVGIDINPAMVALAQRNARGALNCTFKEMDAAAVQYPDATFDRVVVAAGMHHWEAPEAVLAELHRVLRPGGWLVLLDADAQGPVPADWIARRGPWPPTAWLRRNWSRYSLGEQALGQLRVTLERLPWAEVRQDTLGFYRRLVAVR